MLPIYVEGIWICVGVLFQTPSTPHPPSPLLTSILTFLVLVAVQGLYVTLVSARYHRGCRTARGSLRWRTEFDLKISELLDGQWNDSNTALEYFRIWANVTNALIECDLEVGTSVWLLFILCGCECVLFWDMWIVGGWLLASCFSTDLSLCGAG